MNRTPGDPPGRPLKRSIAVAVHDERGRLLVVKRAEDDESLPGVWGLPAATPYDGESAADTVARIGRQKLGVGLRPAGRVGEDRAARADHVLHLDEYTAEVVDGTPAAPQDDASVSQYDTCAYVTDPAILRDAARQGSLCSRIYLRSAGLTW